MDNPPRIGCRVFSNFVKISNSGHEISAQHQKPATPPPEYQDTPAFRRATQKTQTVNSFQFVQEESDLREEFDFLQ